MAEIGIFGIGSIGSLLSKYILLTEKHNCYFFNRSPKHEIYITFRKKTFLKSIQLSTNVPKRLDWLIVCLKEYHYEEAMLLLRELIQKDTKIVVFRNGLDLKANFSGLTEEALVLESIIDCPIQKNDRGELIQVYAPKIVLPNTALGKEFIHLLPVNEITFRISDEFKREQWEKLIGSSSLGSVQVLADKPSVILKEEKYLDLFKKLVREGICVAISEGVAIQDDWESKLLNKTLSYPDNKGSSMLSDKMAGRQIELDAKIGVILKKGRANHVEIPNTERVHAEIVKNNNESFSSS